MVKLPTVGNVVANRIYQHYNETADDWRRPHLGASQIGAPCHRKLWYIFRWAKKRILDGRLLRLFKRGDIEEEWVVDDLKAIGVAIDERDPSTGDQWYFKWHGGHFGGSCDGLIHGGVPTAEKSMHVFECKTSNAKWFKTIVKQGVARAKPEHYSQMQVYMHGFRERGYKVDRALYVVVNKDSDEITTERVVYDKRAAEALIRKAELVVGAPNPLERISDDPMRMECKFCDFSSICHFEKVEDLERNCRTCQASTPLPDGTWFCDHWQRRLSVEDQRRGCDEHLFVPSLLPWEAIDADEKDRIVYYRDRNGIRFVDSRRKIMIDED